MNREDIIKEIKEYFCIEEFVDIKTFSIHGENAWKFIDTDLLHAILTIRKEIGNPMTINNWKWGGQFSQRGLRTNISQIVKDKTNAGKLYLSAHLFGKAVDFDIEGMTAEQVREWIVARPQLFNSKIRLEHKFVSTGKVITWVHLDVFQEDKNPKVYMFNV